MDNSPKWVIDRPVGVNYTFFELKANQMQVQMIVARMVMIGILAFPAFGQALAEGAMLHAHSAAAGAKVGSTLGKALTSATEANADRLQTVKHASVPGKVQNVPHSSTQVAGSGHSDGALTITSIRGAANTCPIGLAATSNAGNASASSSAGPTASESPSTASALSTTAAPAVNSAESPNCSNATRARTESNSVVHVSFH
jgi:hypothetical protein